MGELTARVRASTQEQRSPEAAEQRAPAGAVRPLARPPRAVAGDALGRALEQAFDADFSDVQVHEGSSLAAGMGATAFARGSEIHLAPGAPSPGTRAGDRLLAHELAHVVQQREGLARPTARTATGDLADTSPALEADADAQADRAVRGLDARPPAPRSAAPAAAHAEPVVQGSFVASAKLSPVAGTDPPIGLDGLHVASVEITNKKRPPTRLEGSQGRHTVAWQAKTVYWKKLFSNASATDIVTRLATLAESDEQADIAARDNGTAGRRARKPLLDWLEEVRAATRTLPSGVHEKYTRPSSELIEKLEWALRTYVKAYQKGSFTAFASGNAVGKGESTHLKRLAKAEIGPLPADHVLWKAAGGLVDLHPSIQGGQRKKIATDAVDLLKTLYPKVHAHLEELAAPKNLDEVLFPPNLAHDSMDSDSDSDSDSDVDVANDEIPGMEPFLVRLSSRPTDAHAAAYEPGALNVDRVLISDERPPTRFGTAQMSHTIPWSLERLAWTKAFSGKTVAATIAELQRRLVDEAAWSDTLTAELRRRRPLLETRLTELAVATKTLAEWTAELDACIEEYVALYQLAPFATFGTEATTQGDSTARGRGEYSALEFFGTAEKALGQTPPGAADLGEAKAKAAALIDVPQLDDNRTLVDVDRLKRRWLEEMTSLFPNVMATARERVRSGLDATAVQTDRGRELSALNKQVKAETRAGRKRREEPEALEKRKDRKKTGRTRRVATSKTGGRQPATITLKGKDADRMLDRLQKKSRSAVP